MMDRRTALASILALIASPAFAQQGRVWRVGILSSTRRPASMATHRLGAFVVAMRELGYVEGKNLSIEWRFSDEGYERLPALAAELVKLNPDVILSAGTPATRAAQKATNTVPIVMTGVGDPVGTGLVDSLARPGRNITGVSVVSVDLGSKWFELARSLVPNLERIGVLLNSANPAYAATLENAWKAARHTNVLVFPAEARSAAQIERAFDQLKRAGVAALIIHNDSLYIDQARQVGELAIKTKLPAVAGRSDAAEAGVLVSYGPNFNKAYRRAASYVDKIFKGAKPGDLPVEQPTDYELVVNLKTAKAIGLNVPRDLVLRADKVIE